MVSASYWSDSEAVVVAVAAAEGLTDYQEQEWAVQCRCLMDRHLADFLETHLD